MARKETVTKQTILDSAFEMAREEGFECVTARKLAIKTGCSTQPIFRVYTNMEELLEALRQKASDYFDIFYDDAIKMEEEPFVDLGMTYIRFAISEKNLFKMLFLSDMRNGKSLYETLNAETGAVSKEIEKAQRAGCKAPGELFMKMWIFIHGAACMSITGDYDLSEEETMKLLKDSYYAFSNIMR